MAHREGRFVDLAQCMRPRRLQVFCMKKTSKPNKLATSKLTGLEESRLTRLEERRRTIEEYADDLREIIRQLRQKTNSFRRAPRGPLL